MIEFVLNTIFWTLAIYGLFEIIKNIIYINTYTKFIKQDQEKRLINLEKMAQIWHT